jgi:hypothetical protein
MTAGRLRAAERAEVELAGGGRPVRAIQQRGAAILEGGRDRVQVIPTERRLDAWRHVLEGGGRELGDGAGADERTGQQDVGTLRRSTPLGPGA